LNQWAFESKAFIWKWVESFNAHFSQHFILVIGNCHIGGLRYKRAEAKHPFKSASLKVVLDQG
jgi:hypothetical protein